MGDKDGKAIGKVRRGRPGRGRKREEEDVDRVGKICDGGEGVLGGGSRVYGNSPC